MVYAPPRLDLVKETWRSRAGNTTSRLHLSQHVPQATGMALLPHSSFVLPQITHLILCPGVFMEQYLLSWLFQDVL